MSLTTYETVTFNCAIPGYQVYRNIWQPKFFSKLQCYHVSDNDYYLLFAIKTYQDAEFYQEVVGHLRLRISRFSKFLLDRGTKVTATHSSTHYQRSPLVEGGLEIPCVVNSKLIGTKKNTEISAKYLEIVKTRYTEPSFDENVIICSFLAMSLIEYANTVNGKD